MKRFFPVILAVSILIACVVEIQTTTQQATVTSIPYVFQGNTTPDPVTYDIFGNRSQGLDSNRYNGYYNEFGNWIPGVVKAESQFLVMPDLVMGDAWGYGVGRGIHSFDMRGTIDGIIVPFCSEIGNYVWVKREGYEWEGAFRVVDCAARYDIYNVIVHRQEVVEVKQATAIAWNMWVNYGDYWGWNMRKVENVLVSKINPDCLPDDLEPVVLSEWFKDNVSFWETKEAGMQWEDDNPSGILTKNPEGIPFWRINGEWVSFPRNSKECN